jgi:hypothetical protein
MKKWNLSVSDLGSWGVDALRASCTALEADSSVFSKAEIGGNKLAVGRLKLWNS